MLQEWVWPCFKLFGRLPFLGPHPCQQLLMVFPFHQRLQPEWFPTQSNHFLGQKFHVQNSELHNYPVQKNTKHRHQQKSNIMIVPKPIWTEINPKIPGLLLLLNGYLHRVQHTHPYLHPYKHPTNHLSTSHQLVNHVQGGILFWNFSIESVYYNKIMYLKKAVKYTQYWPCFCQVLRYTRHVFHTTGHNNVIYAQLNTLGGKHCSCS